MLKIFPRTVRKLGSCMVAFKGTPLKEVVWSADYGVLTPLFGSYTNAEGIAYALYSPTTENVVEDGFPHGDTRVFLATATKSMDADHTIFGEVSLKLEDSRITSVFVEFNGDHFDATAVASVTGTVYVRNMNGGPVSATMTLENASERDPIEVTAVCTAIGGGWYECVGSTTFTGSAAMTHFGIEVDNFNTYANFAGWRLEPGIIAGSGKAQITVTHVA